MYKRQGQGIAVQPCQKGLALLGLVGLGREGWGVEIGAGASFAADEALFSQAGQGGHQGGQGPGSMVPQLLENLAGGQRGLGGPKNLHDLQLRLPQALAVDVYKRQTCVPADGEWGRKDCGIVVSSWNFLLAMGWTGT